jgi:hypothetical protein
VDERVRGAEDGGRTDAGQHQKAAVHVVGQPAARFGGQDERHREQRPRDADLETGGAAGQEEQRPTDVVDPLVSPRAAPQMSAPIMERLRRTRRSGTGSPSAPADRLRRAVADAGSRMRTAETHANERQDPRRQKHDPHESGPDDAADQRPDGHAGQLAAVDGGEGPAAALDGRPSRDHGQPATMAAPAPTP